MQGHAIFADMRKLKIISLFFAQSSPGKSRNYSHFIAFTFLHLISLEYRKPLRHSFRCFRAERRDFSVNKEAFYRNFGHLLQYSQCTQQCKGGFRFKYVPLNCMCVYATWRRVNFLPARDQHNCATNGFSGMCNRTRGLFSGAGLFLSFYVNFIGL